MSDYEDFAQEFKIITDREMEVSSLNERIIIQKIAYLLFNMIGKDFQYNEFTWYLHGVFCWELWRDALNQGTPSPELARLDTPILTNLDYIKKDFVQSGLTNYFFNVEDLELITTVLYSARERRGQDELYEDNSDLITHVMALKNKFDEKRVRDSITIIKKIKWNFNQ